MKYHLFNTPIITPVLRVISRIILKALGWTVVGKFPKDLKKCVVIGAPHTSNWDFPIFLMTALVLDLNVTWLGKHTLFAFPFRSVMTWFGGKPINRTIHEDVVFKATQMLSESDECIIAISPEGTRKATSRWRTGFWYMARNAKVPIMLAFIDYRRKRCGLHGVFDSSGYLEVDIERIKEFYSRHFTGKHPHNFAI